MTHELILASQSPRRKQLLIDGGYTFIVDAPDDSVERGICSNCSPEELVIESAFLKAAAIAGRHSSGLVLAADTVAVCGSETLGKPTNREHAEKMLRMMSGKEHRVLTGVCLRLAGTERIKTWLEQTTLVMSVFEEEKLQKYLDSDGWVGKAGAFGYQDGLDWVRIVNGLESTVVGLPIEKLPAWIDELTTECL